MKYLILGSSGQIGSALVDYIQKAGHEPLLFDRTLDINQDLRIPDNSVLLNLMKEADFIFFLAFDVGGSRYLNVKQNTFEFVSDNVMLMENTFNLIRKAKKPFIFTSTQMSNMEYSSYGLLKSLGELYTNILNGLVVKFWNVYGVEKDFNKSHVITDFIVKARESRVIDLLTNGKELRQFLYAEDCSECLIKLSQEYNRIPRNKNLHITSFKWHSILDVANIVSELYPNTIIKPTLCIDEIQKNKRNEPDPFILRFWTPKTSLHLGIKQVNDLMLSN